MKSVVLMVSMLAIAAIGRRAAAGDGSCRICTICRRRLPTAGRPAHRGQAPGAGGRGGPQIDVPWNDAIPPGTADHAARALKESSRHGEWADIKTGRRQHRSRAGSSIPSGAQKAGVVLVIHDIRGMSDIARAMGDQLAQDGFIAIVPDFLSGKGPNGGGTVSLGAGCGQDHPDADA